MSSSLEGANMSVVHSFPKLYAIDKNGKIKVWTAAVLQSKGGSSSAATSRTTHGYIDGKQQTAYRDYNTGKNIGKSNETTPLAQCIAETQRKWTDKKEKEAYSETKPADCGEGYGDISGNGVGDGGGDGDGVGATAFTVGPFLPMLAQTFNPADAISAAAATGSDRRAGRGRRKRRFR